MAGSPKPAASVASRMLIFLLFFIALASGCRQDHFAPVTEMIEGGNYRQALARLNLDTTLARLDQERYLENRALARLVEGDFSGGFADLMALEPAESSPSQPRVRTAKLMVDAAETILREPDRVAEALALFDSAYTCDPKLDDRIQKLLWNRGLEYLDLPGEAGYWCFLYASRRDPHTLGRLTGYNRLLSDRYYEILTVREELTRWQDAADAYTRLYSLAPGDFQDLIPFTPPEARDTLRTGWRYFLEVEGDSVILGARVTETPPRMALPRTIVRLRG